MEGGRVVEQGTFDQLMHLHDGKFKALVEEFGGKKEEATHSEKDNSDSHANEEEKAQEKGGRIRLRSSASAASASEPKKKLTDHKSTDNDDLANLMQSEERQKGGVALSVYMYYLESGGGWIPFSILLLFLSMSVGSNCYSTWWLSDWTDDSFHKPQTFYVSGVVLRLRGIWLFLN
jgi:hypothetical protein